jgi:hypothetical protein
LLKSSPPDDWKNFCIKTWRPTGPRRRRKVVEEPFGWCKNIGGLARPRFKGVARQGFLFTSTMAAYDLVRLPKLLGALAA